MTSTCRILTACAAVAVAGFAVTPRSAAGQTPDLETVVDSFYPAELTDLSLKVGVTPVRRQCFAVLETDAAGNARVIVAAYTNLHMGAVRVLQADGTGFRLVAEPAGEAHAGWGCEVDAVDVDLDGRNEAHVAFTANNGSFDWVYAWDGQQLINLTPMRASKLGGVLMTELINASVIDTDGDGLLEVKTLSQVEGDEAPLPGKIYRLSNGRFVLDRAVVGVYPFEPSTGTPEIDVVDVLTPVGAQGPFTLRVFNGAGAGARVQSGRVWLNGEEIVHPSDFGAEIAVIERTVNLKAENELRVQLAGAPDARITIVIDAASWAPKEPVRAP